MLWTQKKKNLTHVTSDSVGGNFPASDHLSKYDWLGGIPSDVSTVEYFVHNYKLKDWMMGWDALYSMGTSARTPGKERLPLHFLIFQLIITDKPTVER